MSTESNQHLLKRLKAIQANLLAHHDGGFALPSAARGQERETFVRDYLKELFPPAFRFGSGAVTDATGALSGQLDVVVEYPFFPSLPMPNGKERLYLAESVALAIEVKSDVCSQWDEIERGVKALRPVQRRWTDVHQKGENVILQFTRTVQTPVPCIAVGYRGFKSIEALKRRLEQTDEDRRPEGVLVVESGVFVGDGCTASGAWGLYALLVAMADRIRSVTSAEFDLGSYAGAAAGNRDRSPSGEGH